MDYLLSYLVLIIVGSLMNGYVKEAKKEKR